MSICLDDIPKTRSKVKGAWPSLDYPVLVDEPQGTCMARESNMVISYIDRTCIIAWEVDNRLSSIR